MRLTLKPIWFSLFFAILSISLSANIAAPVKAKNILIIYSYQQGYNWMDSLSVGVLAEFKKHPGTNLYIEYLNSKQFGQTNFEKTARYFQEKYAPIHFDGVLVTDNDALDFAFRYDKILFPNVPVVFAGVTNPDDYQLDGTLYYGCKEAANTDFVLKLIGELLPKARRVLILTDFTTTGMIHREAVMKQVSGLIDFSIFFPEVIDLDSIYKQVSSVGDFDAIFYAGINQDKSGERVDVNALLDTICQLANVPVFSSEVLFVGKGLVGVQYQNGAKHGRAAVKLLAQLMNPASARPVSRYSTTEFDYYFDWRLLKKYNISLDRLPKGSILVNKPNLLKEGNFIFLIGLLGVLISVVVVLSAINRRRKIAQQKSDNLLREIETQKSQLEEASIKLNTVISQLAASNDNLIETNTSLFEAKKKAEESDRLKSAFLANVSHEIRTPLNSIVGFSSLLNDPDLSEEKKSRYNEVIYSNTESLLRLIDDIIDLSKIDAGQITLKKEEFSVDELMLELFRIFSQNNSNVKVELKIGKPIEGNLLYVYSDRVRLRQILINLLSNAFKFTEKGTVEMGYSCSENQEIVFYVRDTGIGISKDHHQVIFHRFRKLNESKERIYPGTGLGLAITQKLVELLGGRIWVESESGKGSTFCFTLQDCILK